MEQLHIGLTRDFLQQAPDPWAMGLDWLRHDPRTAWSWLGKHTAEVQPHQLDGMDAVIAWTPRWTPASVSESERLLLIARWGVGYDHVDLAACTAAGVMVTITPDAVKRPVATANVAMVLALATRMFGKDADTRAGLWQQNSLVMPGPGLRGKTLGSIGFGNVAKESFRLLAAFGMKFIACSPSARQEDGNLLQVKIGSMEAVLTQSDFLMINCPLNASTRHMLGSAELAMMKPAAFLINLARGAIVQEAALVEALQQGRLAGAGLDVFESEPLPADHPLTRMAQVILAPHSLALTEELFARMADQHRGIIDALLRGETPPHVINKEVLQTAKFRQKQEALLERLRH
jgi:phosphoglycerate dehydrogenase-like enzyme